jgi:hypothetical protein
MLMPKAAVNEDDCSAMRHDDIRRPGKALHMEVITEAQLSHDVAHDKLRRRVLPADLRH